jgi:4-alpha-glucanotransferase
MHWAFIRAAFASVARMAIVPLQDFLGLGSDARMNTPSLSDGNWGWRVKKIALTNALAQKVATLSIVSDRNLQALAADQQRDGEVREDFAA